MYKYNIRGNCPVYRRLLYAFSGSKDSCLIFVICTGLQVYLKINFLISQPNICYGYSKEPPQGDISFEHLKKLFELMDKQITTILRFKFSLSLTYILYFRNEANVRRLEVQQKDQLSCIQKDTIRMLRAIMHFRDQMIHVLDKETLRDPAQSLQDLGSLLKDKVNNSHKYY